MLEQNGYGCEGASNTSKLSGGERQRVAIARALINQPKVILADEPTGNLDERTAGEVMELLLQACQEAKASLILVTHNRKYAEATNRTTILSDGELQRTIIYSLWKKG